MSAQIYGGVSAEPRPSPVTAGTLTSPLPPNVTIPRTPVNPPKSPIPPDTVIDVENQKSVASQQATAPAGSALGTLVDVFA